MKIIKRIIRANKKKNKSKFINVSKRIFENIFET